MPSSLGAGAISFQLAASRPEGSAPRQLRQLGDVGSDLPGLVALEELLENYAGNSHGKLATFTIVGWSRCHCVVMPAAMMARAAASAMMEVVYIVARIML